MSKFSGKCDFYDYIEIMGVDKVLASKIFVGKNVLIPLRMDEERDLIPYYPYLISCSTTNNGVGTIFLTDQSYVDTEENERLNLYLKLALKYYKRCKRKHIPFNIEEAHNAVFSALCSMEDWEKQLLQRVENDSKKADISDIHMPIYEFYRKKLYDELITHGYSPILADYHVWHDSILF